MLEPAAARDKAASLVELARRQGADAADAAYVGERSQGVSVRLGALEDVHRSEGEEIGLRVFIGQRNATIASSDLSKEALDDAGRPGAGDGRAKRPRTNIAGLAPEELLFRGAPADLDLDDGGDPDPAELKQRALAAEDASPGGRRRHQQQRGQRLGLGVDLSPSPPAMASRARPVRPATAIRPASSPARARRCSATMPGIRRGTSPISSRRRRLGRRAATRAVARLSPVSVKAGRHAGAVRPKRSQPRCSAISSPPSRIGDCPAGKLPARCARKPGLRARRHHP